MGTQLEDERIEVQRENAQRRIEPPNQLHIDRVVVRSWPKILCAYPVAVLGLLFAFLTSEFPTTSLLHDICGRVFFAFIFLTALIGTFDCRGWHILTVTFATFFAILLLWVLSWYLPLVQGFAWVWSHVHLDATPQVYIFFPAVFAIVIGCAAIANRFDFWEVTPNELLHSSGPLSDLKRYPAANIKVEKEIPDVFEWLLLGSGRLVIYPNSERHAVVLDNVLRVNRIEQTIKHVLGALEVRVDPDSI